MTLALYICVCVCVRVRVYLCNCMRCMQVMPIVWPSSRHYFTFLCCTRQHFLLLLICVCVCVMLAHRCAHDKYTPYYRVHTCKAYVRPEPMSRYSPFDDGSSIRSHTISGPLLICRCCSLCSECTVGVCVCVLNSGGHRSHPHTCTHTVNIWCGVLCVRDRKLLIAFELNGNGKMPLRCHHSQQEIYNHRMWD